MTTGDRIRKRREELGMTQTELAKKIGYSSYSTIAKIESGDNNLKQSKIKSFADALETTPAYIMGWDEKEDPTPAYYLDAAAREAAEFLHKNPDYKVLFDASRKIKKEDIDIVRQVIEKFGGITPDYDDPC